MGWRDYLAAAVPLTCISLHTAEMSPSPSTVVLELESFASQSCPSATSYSNYMSLLCLVRWGPQSPPGPWGSKQVLRWLLQNTAALGLLQPYPAGMQSQHRIGMGKGKRVLPEAFLYATA